MNPKNHSEPISRVFDLLPYLLANRRREKVFAFRKNGNWEYVSTEEYVRKSDQVSYALLSRGIQKGDCIISITPNRPEFNMLDMGLLQLGAIHVPLYPGISGQKLKEILSETNCKAVFLNGKKSLEVVLGLQKSIPGFDTIISFDQTAGCESFSEFLTIGEENNQAEKLEAIKQSILTSDPASIIYISGATTAARGVVLSHESHVSTLLSYARNTHMEGLSDIISLLPLAHSYERTINYSQQFYGVTIWYNEKIQQMFRDFRDVRPQAMVMVPLLIERMFQLMEQRTMQSKLIPASYISDCLEFYKSKHKASGIKSSLFSLFAKQIIFPKWRKALGGRLDFILCGGAALDKKYLHLAQACGIAIYEGYGITEAGPLVSYNTKADQRNYTVGKTMPGVEIAIAADGEVCVRSAGLMKGYWKNPEETSAAIDSEGWLHTGDLGRLDKDEFLILTGIKKEIFKLSSGIYVSPANIESELKKSEGISNAWIFGHNRKYLVALILPSEYENSAGSANSNDSSVKLLIEDAVKSYNNISRSPDHIVKYEIVRDVWCKENGLLNAEGQLNRQLLLSKYYKTLESFYAE